MRKIVSLLVGLVIGSTIGGILITLFSPVTSDEFRENLRTHYAKAMEAGRKASAERRLELEQELQQMQES